MSKIGSWVIDNLENGEKIQDTLERNNNEF